MSLTIETGFTEDERACAAALYWQAFGAKLGRVLGPRARALSFLQGVLNPSFALVARGDAGQILGMAGFKTADGGLVDGDMRDLARVYGLVGAAWRAAFLLALERKAEPGVFQMDGICVAADARGQGVGGRLLDAVLAVATQDGCRVVRLDVIDTNPRAQALYERKGFVGLSRSHTGPLRHVFGFRSALRMERAV